MELGGVGLGEVGAGGEAVAGDAVDDAEVGGLGDAALGGGDGGGGDCEHLGGGGGVDVFVVEEGLDHGLVLGDVGEDAELDLGVVGGEEDVALLLGYEGFANELAALGADGDGFAGWDCWRKGGRWRRRSWLKVVWRRPVRGLTRAGRAST